MQTISNNQRSLLLGLLVIGVLLMGIVGLLAVRGQVAALTPTATPTFLPDVPGVTPVEPGVNLTDFTLTDNEGEFFSLSEARGSYALMFFGYTHCPDFCPLTLAEWTRIKSLLGDDASEVKFIFVSVDGERDTPEALDTYLANFDSEFIGLSGVEPTLSEIAPDYGLYYDLRTEEGTNGNYPVDHSTVSYLIDPEGRLRAIFAYDTDPDVIADYVKVVMAQDAG